MDSLDTNMESDTATECHIPVGAEGTHLNGVISRGRTICHQSLDLHHPRRAGTQGVGQDIGGVPGNIQFGGMG